MAQTKISELTAFTTLADDDVLAGVDTSATQTKKLPISVLKAYIDTNTQYTGGTNIEISEQNVISAPNVYNKTETDDLVNNVDTKLTNELNTEVESLRTIWNAFPTTSDEDTSITLNDTAECTFKKLDLKGNTSQETNLSYTCVGTEIGDYYFTYNNTNYQFTMPTITSGSVLVFNTTTLKLYLGTTEISTTSASTGILLTMTNTPNPSYPQDIHSVSGDNTIKVCGKNLWGGFTDFSKTHRYVDFITKSDGTITANGTASGNTAWSSNGSDVSSNNLVVKLNAGTYTFSIDNLPSGVTWQISRLEGTTLTALYSSSSIREMTFTLTEDRNISIRISVDDGTQLNNAIFKIMLEKNNQATTYEPYNGTDYEIDLPVENILDITGNESGKWNDDGTAGANSYNRRGVIYTPVLPNKDYTFSVNTSVTALRLNEYNESKENILQTQVTNNKSLTITTSSTTRYLRWCINYNNVQIVTEEKLISLQPQIEEGTKANKYWAYGTTPIEMCKIGNYQDQFFKNTEKSEYYDSSLEYGKWYKYGMIGKAVLDGSESGWTKNSGITTTNGYSNNALFPYRVSNGGIYCNYLKQVLSLSGNKTGIYNATNCNFLLEGTDYDTETKFKNWLSTYTPIVYYQMSTPTKEILPNSLQEQLNAIERAHSYDNQTNISQVNNDKPFILDVEAILSLQNVLDRVTLLEE